jgi:hypothetical protein
LDLVYVFGGLNILKKRYKPLPQLPTSYSLQIRSLSVVISFVQKPILLIWRIVFFIELFFIQVKSTLQFWLF